MVGDGDLCLTLRIHLGHLLVKLAVSTYDHMKMLMNAFRLEDEKEYKMVVLVLAYLKLNILNNKYLTSHTLLISMNLFFV